MTEHVCMSGRDRDRVTVRHAERLWRARDEAQLWPTRVDYDGCRYDMRFSEPDEFSAGVARLVDAGGEMLMRMEEDALTRMVQAVVAHRLAKRLEAVANAATPAATLDAMGQALLRVVTQDGGHPAFGRAVFDLGGGLSLRIDDMTVHDRELGAAAIPAPWAARIGRLVDERRAADPRYARERDRAECS